MLKSKYLYAFAGDTISARTTSRRFIALLLTLCVVGCGVSESPLRKGGKASGTAVQLRQDLREIVASARDRVFPALVHIHVVSVNYWNGKEHKSRAVGSGTIISDEGYILTNYHVTCKGRKFTCTLADKQELPAELVGEDPLTDLAVLKLDLSKLNDPNKSVAVAKFGDSSELQTGDYVIAMGSPFALSRSVTLGIVSNTERVFTDASGMDAEDMEIEEGQRTGLFTRWIQHDALINPGNSGGPLVNLEGRIVGINELGGASMGFAIPSNLAQKVAETLIEHGEVPRSWFGVSLKQIKKTGLTEGVLVNSVIEESPADKAGIKAGDVILKIDGEPLTVRFAEQAPALLNRLASLSIGSKVTLTYARNGSTHTTTLTTSKLLKDRGKERAFRAWGLTGIEITEHMARNMHLDNTEGVCVSSIRDGGPAQLAEPPIPPHVVIRSIDDEPIRTLDDLIALYDRVMDTDPLPEYLIVEFDREGKNQITLLKTKPDEDEDPPREVRKAWIGIATQPVLKKLAKKLGDPKACGYRITRVYPKTLAAQSELKVGDIIIALNERKTTPRGMQDTALLARMVRRLDIDATATLTLLRDGKEQKVEVKLEPTRINPAEALRERNRDFELAVREVTFFDRDKQRWDEDVTGVLVDHVEPAGWAGLGGVRYNDLIQKVDQTEITDLDTFRKAMRVLTKDQPERVVFVVLRGSRTRYLYIEPDWKPMSDESGKSKDKKE